MEGGIMSIIIFYFHPCPPRLQQCLRKKMEELEDINKEMDMTSVTDTFDVSAVTGLTMVMEVLAEWQKEVHQVVTWQQKHVEACWMLDIILKWMLWWFWLKAESGRCFILSKLDPYDTSDSIASVIWLSHWDWPLNFHGASMEMLCQLCGMGWPSVLLWKSDAVMEVQEQIWHYLQQISRGLGT